jgi:sulfur carrier protein ThiS adenylyltransferase
MTPIPDRDLRQRDIVPPERLVACIATVIGVGAIGRQVCLQLAALGIPHLQLIDFDTVEPVNLAPQGYLEQDLGVLKVTATAEMVRKIHSGITLEPRPERFRRSVPVGDVVFCCVDKIDTRKLIWEALGQKTRFFADARMSAEVVRVLTACNAKGRSHYPTTLFAAGEAFAGACTAKSTVFTANIAAGLMLAAFAQFLRGMPPEPDVTLNLLAWELTTGSPSSTRPANSAPASGFWMARPSATPSSPSICWKKPA